MAKVLSARHTVWIDFHIPKKVSDILLSVEDNFKSENNNKPGSWWVKYATLHYIDENGEEQQIDNNGLPDMKYPNLGKEHYAIDSDDEDNEEDE